MYSNESAGFTSVPISDPRNTPKRHRCLYAMQVKAMLRKDGMATYLKQTRAKSVFYQAQAIQASHTPVNERCRSDISAISRFISRATPIRKLHNWQIRETASTAMRVEYSPGQTVCVP